MEGGKEDLSEPLLVRLPRWGPDVPEYRSRGILV